MKFLITGSGGCVCTPKPLCQCPVCTQARSKGYPFARCGCSLYLQDISMLVDTPEDIAIALNNADIRAVASIMYSLWDPDHTMGMRIMEQLRLEWLDYYAGKKAKNPITVYAHPAVMDDLKAIRSKYGPFLEYYQQMGLVKLCNVERAIEIKGIKITMVPVSKDKAVCVFVFESGGKRVLYAPCDCLPFPDDEVLCDADVLIMGNTFVGDRLKNEAILPANHPLRGELYSLEDAISISEKLRAKRLVITHIEETWGKSFEDYKQIEKTHRNLAFAYDGMVLEV